MIRYTTRQLQIALADRGFNPGPIDGIMGPKTEAAVVAFKRSVGLLARPYVGPITAGKLFNLAALPTRPMAAVPWVNELGKYMGWHEVRNNAELRKWLKSDGRTLGDPKRFPWCGDAIETAIKLTCRNEPWRGRVAANPYLARNWLTFGEPCERRYGAIVVAWRGRRNGTSGHVCVLIGYDPKRKRLRVRGGNQANRISDTWLSEHRVLGYRKPISYTKELPPVPIMNSRGAVVSTNEA
jgi:uncharacterized protein (TIGR02594 family)